MSESESLPAFVRVIVKDKGKYLVLCEARGNQLWNFPGGRCESGEDAEETAKREIAEETGLIVRRLLNVLQREFDIRGQRWNGTFFLAMEAEGEPHILESEKCAQMLFVTEEELLQLPSIRPVLQEVLSLEQVRSLPSSFKHE